MQSNLPLKGHRTASSSNLKSWTSSKNACNFPITLLRQLLYNSPMGKKVNDEFVNFPISTMAPQKVDWKMHCHNKNQTTRTIE